LLSVGTCSSSYLKVEKFQKTNAKLTALLQR